ncbi:peptide chain release factor 3 [Ichthyobacterium seriolicida]|uniref:Peptide chain release factor 3 n=1 Tax=Ichthyobacterium seriolicida TaxID=242600 RepID=A0A1J1DZK4_9FLAO|nr:peptide chain release factor 3 [Ichthyobacterium seriolicida]BAV94101.1 peptide chain release factor 3 [Ichthyobacterium seriolicida]
MKLIKEINRRKTFGIISHPDAGKTTLTEKLLLFGGAIQEAGAVKSNKIKKAAISDFMEIERQRGISVTTTVLSFEYRDFKINILDTPGHKDFAEDTFRTLTAVDSAIVVIDAAKGIEQQTEKLVEVCRLRKTPIIVFVNKIDKEGKDAFDILDDIETKLNLKVTPLSWPIGMGSDLKGVYDIWASALNLFTGQKKQVIEESISIDSLEDEKLQSLIGEKARNILLDDISTIRGVYPEFRKEEYLDADICPVFFGSALTNFGIRELLNCFVKIAPSPTNKKSDIRLVEASENTFSGFVFKIHANIDPKHRNRLAFVKVVSGIFKRNTSYLHIRHNKHLKFSSPNTFFAEKKMIVGESFPGDIVGLYDTGNFKIGDTLTEGEILNFKGIPSFSPEHFRYINNSDPLKTKQLNKGIFQLMDEGVAQLFTMNMTNRKLIGTVGALQYDIIQYRLENEYGAKCTYENIPIYKACWVEAEKGKEFDDFKRVKSKYLAVDKEGNLVFLADSAFTIQMTKEKYPSIKFHYTSEFK